MAEKINRFLEKLAIVINAWLIFFKKEKQYGTKNFSFRKFYLFKKGFYSDHPIPYDFINHSYSDYISDIETIKLAYLNYPYGRLLRNKLVFSNYFRYYFKTPECYCIINKGNIEQVNVQKNVNSFSSLTELLFEKKLILKPILGTCGIGIILIEKKDENDFLVNKKMMSSEEVKKLISSLDDYLVTEFIEQGVFSKQFFPETTNTIRLTTFCNPETASSFVPYSLMRFGRPKTIPADNSEIGGIFSMIDLNTGELSDAVEIVEKGKIKYHERHPDTNVLIKGVIIPQWRSLLEYFIKIGGLIKPYIKVAGWDIVLTDNSFVVIEGNNGPDLYSQGKNYPFAKQQEVLDFLKQNQLR